MAQTTTLATREPGTQETSLESLAQDLIRAGSSCCVASALTGLGQRALARIHRDLCASGDRFVDSFAADPHAFFVPPEATTPGWALQRAVFLEGYQRLARADGFSTEPGRRLLSAFQHYQAVCAGRRLMDLNQCYALLSTTGMLQDGSRLIGQFDRRCCRPCGVGHLASALKNQHAPACPMCQILKSTVQQCTRTTRAKAW